MSSNRSLLSRITTMHFGVVLLLTLAVIVCTPLILHAQSDNALEDNIHIATLEGDYEAIKRFLDAGVSPDEYNSTGFAPLHSAARANRSDIVELLLDYGADVNIQSRTSIDPEQGGLHIAARNGYLDLIDLLLARGADPNLQDSRGNTPLHDAAISGDRSITRALIRSGADVGVRNVAGEDVLEVADESLGRAALSRNQIAITTTTGVYLGIDDLFAPSESGDIGAIVSDGFFNGLLNADISVAFSMLFPIGNSIFFIGPEAGLTVSHFVLTIVSASNLFIARIPIHAVFNIAARHNFTFDIIAGTILNTWISTDVSNDGTASGMTFDVGGRVEVNDLFIELQYILPVSVPFGDTLGSSMSYMNNIRQNSLRISIGHRARL